MCTWHTISWLHSWNKLKFKLKFSVYWRHYKQQELELQGPHPLLFINLQCVGSLMSHGIFIYMYDHGYRVWARIWSLGDNLSPWLKFRGTFLFLGGQKSVHSSADAKRFVSVRFPTKIAELIAWDLFIAQPRVMSWFFRFPSILVRFSLINTLSSSSVSFFPDSLWLWFEVKKLSNVRTRFRCDMLTIARRVHHAWLEHETYVFSRAWLKRDFRMLKYTFHVVF